MSSLQKRKRPKAQRRARMVSVDPAAAANENKKYGMEVQRKKSFVLFHSTHVRDIKGTLYQRAGSGEGRNASGMGEPPGSGTFWSYEKFSLVQVNSITGWDGLVEARLHQAVTHKLYGYASSGLSFGIKTEGTSSSHIHGFGRDTIGVRKPGRIVQSRLWSSRGIVMLQFI